MPCSKARYHIGQCHSSAEIVQSYQEYAHHLRQKAANMTRQELVNAVEFHLLAWRVLRGEYLAR